MSNADATDLTASVPVVAESGAIKPPDSVSAPASEPLAAEWATYQRELPRLLTEGYEGKFILIRDAEIIGFFSSWDDARNEGLRRFHLTPFFVKRILEIEPRLRIRGKNYPWPAKRI